MLLLEKLRYYVFWLLDFVKGSHVRNHYKDIKFILENYGSAEASRRMDKHLSGILNHAVASVPYYKKHKKYNCLRDFPVVNKVLLREFVDDFISEKFKGKKSYQVSTSGSTGTPFVVYQDKNKKLRNTADTIYFSERAGYRIGHKLFYIRAWNKLIKKNKLASFLQNIRMLNVKYLNPVSISKFIKEIEKSASNNAFIGYPSAFKEICKYLDDVKSKPLNLKVSSMIANAEPLGEPTKKAVKKYFGFDMLSRYSNMENGILSQQFANAGNSFHINWASYYIEILDIKKDKPAGYGTMGRVVVTDLFNYHMPLIRYDTGDLAIMDVDKDSKTSAPSFIKVEGRQMDAIYTTDGRIMTTVVYELEYFPEFKQFQLIQENKNTYLVKINLEGIFKQEEKMVTILKNLLGEDAIVKIEYVEEIPELSSGKRKLTLNKLLN